MNAEANRSAKNSATDHATADLARADLVKRAVKALADVPEAHFGAHKTFLAAIEGWLASEGYLDGVSHAEFQAFMLELNRLGLVSLARADLVGAMDLATVQASELRSRGSTFHFVVVL